MGSRISSWLELFQSLREAFMEVVRAEVRALRSDFELSKRQLGRAAGLAILTVFVLFWAVGVLVLLLIQVAGLWLPAWAAALLVLVALLLVALGLAASARSTLRKIEEPSATIRRHVQDHMDWWEDQILPPAGSDAKELGASAAQASADSRSTNS